MFKPKEMSRAIIVGHKDVMEDTVNALHDINTFHIENFEEDDSGFKIGRSFQNAGDLSHKLVKLRSISSFLGLKPQEQNKQNVEDLLKDLDSKLLELENVVAEKNSHKNRLENQSKELETLKKDIIPFSGFSLDLGLFKGYKNITFIAGSVKEYLTDAVAEVTQSYEIEQDLEIGTVVLFIRNEDRDKVLK
ncbi:MAG: V-type ATP synthase subunit I, partial [Methanosarcinaceae archaeon]